MQTQSGIRSSYKYTVTSSGDGVDYAFYSDAICNVVTNTGTVPAGGTFLVSGTVMGVGSPSAAAMCALGTASQTASVSFAAVFVAVLAFLNFQQ